jgi:N-ethylmaleimide reductase
MILHTPIQLGPLPLKNRIVMAPMTRSRAIGSVANALTVEYYSQRATAGLIVTEGTSPSPNGLGYARIPGLFTEEQAASWKAVTAAVHARGGHIVAQLMHTGRVGHSLNLPPGGRILAPSAVAAAGAMYTDAQGMQPHPVPEAMTLSEVRATVAEFGRAAKLAQEAGFDGVELHGANGYLIEQFLNPHTNRRTDEYGGSVKARARFAREAVEAAAESIGRSRVGIRLSPFSTFNDLPVYPEVAAQYEALAESLNGLLYVHLIQNAHADYPALEKKLRAAIQSPLILALGFDQASAELALESQRADLISFGRPFIANPDLVERMLAGLPLASPNPATFYTPGAEGYVDYPRAAR